MHLTVNINQVGGKNNNMLSIVNIYSIQHNST